MRERTARYARFRTADLIYRAKWSVVKFVGGLRGWRWT